MMTKNKNSSMDNTIESLLKDVLSFLENEIERGQINLGARPTAIRLIDRCKIYVKETMKSLDLSQEIEVYNNTPYVDMQTKTRTILDEYVESNTKTKEEIGNQEALYQNPSLNLSDTISNSSAMDEEGNSCPYANLSAQKVDTCEKNGPLIKKEKFLFIEHHKKMYAAIQKTFFLLYWSEKERKPFQTIDLTNYQAKVQQNSGKESKRRNAKFQLVSINKKSYQFIAQSEEDAIEWIKAINRKITKKPGNNFKTATVVHQRNLPPLPKSVKEKVESNTYEIVDVDYTEIESNDMVRQEEGEDKRGKEIPIPLPPRIPDNFSFKSPLYPSKKCKKGQNVTKKSKKQFPNLSDLSSNYDTVIAHSTKCQTNNGRDLFLWQHQRKSSIDSNTYDTIETADKKYLNNDKAESEITVEETNKSYETNFHDLKQDVEDKCKKIIDEGVEANDKSEKEINDDSTDHETNNNHVKDNEIFNGYNSKYCRNSQENNFNKPTVM